MILTAYVDDPRVDMVSEVEFRLPEAWVVWQGKWRVYTLNDRLVGATEDLDEAIAIGLGDG